MKKILLVIVGLAVFSLAVPVAAKVSNDPNNTQWAYEHVFVNDAWDYTVGSPKVIVAVIDNGFDTFHPDLRGNVWKNVDEIWGNDIDDDNNGYIDDVWGWNFVDNNNDPRPMVAGLSDKGKEAGVFNHGTLVAGLIGAVGNNNIDGVGINWKVKLMNIKVIGNSGSGSIAFLAEAIYYAVDNGAQIINISMVGGDETGAITAAVNYAFEHDVAVIAAMGNGLQDLDYNPLYPVCADADLTETRVLGVSAISKSHRLAGFSNGGTSCVDITAPGEEINSLLRYSPTNGLSERYGNSWHGTSFSTPLVTGAAALIKSLQPSWGPTEIFHALTSTVHHTPGQDEVVYANLFGAGLLQINKAVEFAAQSKAVVASTRNNLVFYDTMGEAEIYKLDSKKKELLIMSVLTGVDDAVSYNEDDEIYLVNSQPAGNKKRIITFYKLQDDLWLLLRSWAITASDTVKLAAVDINQDDKLEIIIINSTGVWQIYSQYGVLLETPTNLEKIGKISDMTAGDFDGDGKIELAVGAYQGNEPFLSIYSLFGSLKRKWWAYDPSYRGGLNLDVLDFDGDNNDDIIITGIDQPVRIWSYKAKKLYQTRITDKLLAY